MKNILLWVKEVLRGLGGKSLMLRFINVLSGDIYTEDEKLEMEVKMVLVLIEDFEAIRPKLESRGNLKEAAKLSEHEEEIFAMYNELNRRFPIKPVKVGKEEVYFEKFYNKILRYLELKKHVK